VANRYIEAFDLIKFIFQHLTPIFYFLAKQDGIQKPDITYSMIFRKQLATLTASHSNRFTGTTG
jgi:hypothetical protein